MKIGFFTERMRLGFGVDLVVDEQARRLLAKGYEVVVVVIHADLALPSPPYELVVLNRVLPPGDFSSEAWMKLALSVCRVDADLWVLATPPFYGWAKYLDGPVILVEYGAPPGYMFPRSVGQHLDSMVEHRFEETYRNLLPCDAIVSISDSIHQWLPRHAQPLSNVIHLGCDHYARAPKEQAQALRASLGFGPDDCMILWVGRMQLDHDEQPYKGFKDLLSLIPLALPHLKRANFVLAGRVTDSDKHRLERKGLTVLANLTPEEMGCAYSAADVLVNLSKWEGFNFALLEAQYQGTPVVAFDIGPHPEVVARNETGVLAKSSQEFFEAVVKVVNDRAFREKLAARASEFAERFSWELSVAKIEEVIAVCAARRLSRAEIAALRKNALETKSQIARPHIPEDAIRSTKDLLALDGRDFVRAARRILLERGQSEEFETTWLRKLRRGASKPAILLQMAEVAQTQGTYREFPGLGATLLRARIAGALGRLLARRDVAKASDASEWRDLQDEIFVQHAYRTLLGREAAPQEIVPKVEQLRSGRNRACLLSEIRCSNEGKGRPLEDPELIRMLRSNDVMRQPSVPGRQRFTYEVALEWGPWQGFVDDLLSLGRPVTTCKWFRYADDVFVRRAYLVLLGREATDADVAAKVARLRQGQTRHSMLAEIRFSVEGHQRRLRDRDLRRILLPDVLRRRPPQPPRQPSLPLSTHAQCIWGGISRVWKPLPVSRWDLLEDEDFVRQAFTGLLDREVDPATANGLAAQLRDGRSRLSILTEIRFSAEGRKRRLLDPDLRQILFFESLRRVPPISWLSPAEKPGDHEPEDTRRQVRRIESRQRVFVAQIGRLEAALSAQGTHFDRSLGAVLGELKESGPTDHTTSSDPAPCVFTPFTPAAAPLRLGAAYVALVSPDAALDHATLPRLTREAHTASSDIVLGDEIECLERSPFQRLRIHGPFSHEAFLRNPDLGSVIAVREDLLSQLSLSPTTALTGKVALQLVSAAHTITHLPVTLGRRAARAIIANRPTLQEMESYIGGIGREATIRADGDDRDGVRFDVRFPISTRWKAAIIATSTDDDPESDLDALRSLTPPHRYHLAVVRADQRSYGRLVNTAIFQAPADCNLVVVMEAGVTPTSPDWLERLAESALRPETGVVAPRTLYPNGGIRHAGLSFGEGEFCIYVSRFAHVDDSADSGQEVDLDRLKGLRAVSAVSRHCMVFRRSLFRDQCQFAVHLNREVSDIDFCCRLRRAGLSILLDGRVVMLQEAAQPRWARSVSQDHLVALKAKQGRLLSGGDPFWVPSQGPLVRSTFLPPLAQR